MSANPIVVRAYLMRAFRIWIATRLIVIATFLFAGEDPFHLPIIAEVLLVLISVGLCFADVHRRRERAFLGNMTLQTRELALLFLLPAMLGEAVFRTIVAVL